MGEVFHVLLRCVECNVKGNCEQSQTADRYQTVTGHRTPKLPKMSRTLSTRPLSSRSLFSTIANCSSSLRCSRVNEVGVTTRD